VVAQIVKIFERIDDATIYIPSFKHCYPTYIKKLAPLRQIGTGLRTKFLRTEVLSGLALRTTANLLSNTGEPPVAEPAAAEVVDAHDALAEPTAERDAAPFALGVFPMSGVWVLISEGGIVFIHGGDRDRVSGLEATQTELIFEVVIGDETPVLSEDGSEEHNLDFVALTIWHRAHDVIVRVLHATSGFDRLAPRATAIHCGLADDPHTGCSHDLCILSSCFPSTPRRHYGPVWS